MKVFAVSLTAGVISTALVGCKDDEQQEISTKYDADIDYDWSQDDKTYTIATNPECPSDTTYADFLTHEYDDSFDQDAADEVLSCMKCLETNVEGLSFKVGDTECDFTSGQKIEECKPFQALKDFVYEDLDVAAANLKKVVDAYHDDTICKGESSIPVFTGLEITENSDSNHPCDGYSRTNLPSSSTSTKENVQEVFSCMKCVADEHESPISYGDCDWTSSASIVYKMDCGAFQKIGDAVATTDASEQTKIDAAFTKCQTPADTR